MADRGSRATVPVAVRVALAAAFAGAALYSAFAARRAAAAPRSQRPRALRSCADKPGSTREVLQLACSQVRWLAAMKRKYALTDIGKALRICIMYASSLDAASQAALLSEAQAAKDDPSRGREEGDFALRGAQRAWLTAATKQCGASDASAALRWLLDGIIDTAPEEVVFGVRRCASAGDACGA